MCLVLGVQGLMLSVPLCGVQGQTAALYCGAVPMDDEGGLKKFMDDTAELSGSESSEEEEEDEEEMDSDASSSGERQSGKRGHGGDSSDEDVCRSVCVCVCAGVSVGVSDNSHRQHLLLLVGTPCGWCRLAWVWLCCSGSPEEEATHLRTSNTQGAGVSAAGAEGYRRRAYLIAGGRVGGCVWLLVFVLCLFCCLFSVCVLLCMVVCTWHHPISAGKDEE